MIQLKNASENFKFNVNFYSLKIGELYSSLVKDNLKFKKNNLHLFISKSLKYSFFITSCSLSLKKYNSIFNLDSSLLRNKWKKFQKMVSCRVGTGLVVLLCCICEGRSYLLPELADLENLSCFPFKIILSSDTSQSFIMRTVRNDGFYFFFSFFFLIYDVVSKQTNFQSNFWCNLSQETRYFEKKTSWCLPGG